MKKCYYCKMGDTVPGFVTSVGSLKSMTIVIKCVPADVCGNCGEGYYGWDVSMRLGEITDAAKREGVETVVRWYDADKTPHKRSYSANGTEDSYNHVLRVSDYPVNEERTCFLCKNGELETGDVTDTSLTRGTVAIVVRGVPAEVCNNCRETYLEPEVYEQLKAEFEDAEKAGVEFMVRKYKPAEVSREKVQAEVVYADAPGE